MNISIDSETTSLLVQAPVALAVFDKQMRYLFHTAEWSQFFNEPVLLGQNHRELFPESSAEWDLRFRNALLGEQYHAHAKINDLIGNDPRILDIDFTQWRLDDGSVSGVIVVIKDISDEALKDRALATLHRRFDRATHAGRIGVFEYEFDRDGVFINPIGMELLDLSLMEFDQIDTAAIRSRLASRSQTKFDHAIERCRAVDSSIKLRLDVQARDNTVRTLEVQLTSQSDAQRIYGVTGLFTDVTRELALSHEAEQALLEAQATSEELQEQQEQQRRMFAVIGHELRTPAAALKMLIDTDPTLSQSDQFPTFQSTIEQLLTVLNELRAVVQPQAREAVTLKTQSPGQVIREVVDAMSPGLEEMGIKVHIDVNRVSSHICTFNTQALRQILSNLIRNVEIHSGATELWVKLHSVEMKRDSSRLWAQLVVSDNGRGIPPLHQERIFQPFYRVDESRDGSGIGLNLCQSLAGSLGGVISYEDRPEGGAQFVLNMMLDRIEEVSSGGLATEEASPMPEQPTDLVAGKYILVAEDNKTIQMITKAILMKAGAKVAVADNGEHAFEMYSNNQLFDFVLTDIFMPVMDGYELTGRLREAGYDRPIIGITAATIGDEADNLLAAGASAVLAKPLELQRLQNVLQTIVR